MSRQEKRVDLFLVFPGQFKTQPKTFHSYSFIKLSRNEAFDGLFSQFYQTATIEIVAVTKISTSVFAIHFQVL